MEEIWKEISGYSGYYQVSNLGNFRSLDRVINYRNGDTRNYPGKLLLTETTKDNYQRIVLSKEGVKTRYMVHRLVLSAFDDNVENKPFVNHIDGNKSNNKLSNLEWCTASENVLHADKLGLRDMSKNNPSNSKKIQCVETGVCYRSCCHAARALGKGTTAVSTIIRSIQRQGKAFGFTWVFIE